MENDRNIQRILDKMIIMEASLTSLQRDIKPVVQAYETATTMGRWFKMTGAAVLMILSIIWAWGSIKAGHMFPVLGI